MKSAVRASADQDSETLIKLQSFTCQNGWAVAVGSVSNFGGPIITKPYVFQAEGPLWVPVTLENACGASKTTARIPTSLYNQACKNTT